MSHEELKARDKVVLRMSRDGAVEENLTQGTREKITNRLEDAQLVKPHEDEPDLAPKGRRKHRQPTPQEFQQQEQEPVQEEHPVSDTQSVKQVTEPVMQEAVSYGGSTANTILTHSINHTASVRSEDGESILRKAAQTAVDSPVEDGIASASKRVQHLQRKSEKAHERLDAARENLPTRKVLKKDRVFDEETGKGKTRLYFEDEVKIPKGQSKLRFEADKTVRKVGDTLASEIHGKIHEAEQENSGVEAAHRTEIVAESGLRHYSHHKKNKANKPFEKVSKLEQEAEAADVKLHFEKTRETHPEMNKHRPNMNRHYQKQAIKREYAAAHKAGAQTASTATKSTGKSLKEKASDKIKEFFSKNKKVFIWFGAGLFCIVLLAAGVSSCTAMFTSTSSSVIMTSYLSEDEAMLGAEAQYSDMEAELQSYLDNYEATHDYDEYHFDLDEIEHDPYVLISILSALHEGEFTLDEVQGTLQMLFEKQYILTEDVEVEVRYRTETRVDSEGNQYDVEVPYNYYICTVTLENFDLSHVPVYIMGEEQLSMYSAYMSTLGNREDLFSGSEYVDKYIDNPPDDYTVNAEYLTDEKFATLIGEAEKYLGYPYVWGGSNPSTSFDCSGFVSYVLTNSGLVNTGRLGAQGLYNVCTPVSASEAKPGDLVFFVGTYDTPGVSHVGIYVGDNVMLHCGDPIQYTSINTSYWQSHFYAFGRPHY